MTTRLLTIPNLLTLARLIAVPFFIVASARGNYTLALIIFGAAAFTDIVDGFIARRLNQRSRLGAILDPAADKTMLMCGFLFYTLRGNLVMQIPPWLTFVVFIRDFLIIMFAYLLYTRVQVKRFPPSWAGKASTLLQAITLGGVIGVNGPWPQVAPMVGVLFRASLVMTLYSAWDYLRRGEQLLDAGIEALQP